MFWPFRPSRQVPEPDRRAFAEVARRARRLRFRLRAEALSQIAGAYHSARPGMGLDFAELRAYEPGDEVRHIDWNVTARFGRPFVRRYQEERSLLLRLIVDVSASLRIGPPGSSKADRSLQLAAMLAIAAIQNHDQIELRAVGKEVEREVPRGSGDRHLERVLLALAASPFNARGTSLTRGLPNRRRRGLTVVISDFLPTPPPEVSAWREAAARGRVIAFRLVDSIERELPNVGLMKVADVETGRRAVIDASSPAARDAYLRAAERRREAFKAWCASTRVEGHEIFTAQDPFHPLLAALQNHSQRRGSP